MNKKYLAAKIAFGFFSVTTVVILSALRDPVGLRAIGITDIAMTMIVVVNFVLLITSTVSFIYQRANQNRPAKERSTLLQAFAEGAQLRERQLSDVRTVRHQDLLLLSEPFATATLPTQDNLSPEHLQTGQTVKLTLHVKPHQYVVAEVISLDSQWVILRRVS